MLQMCNAMFLCQITGCHIIDNSTICNAVDDFKQSFVIVIYVNNAGIRKLLFDVMCTGIFFDAGQFHGVYVLIIYFVSVIGLSNDAQFHLQKGLCK